MPKVPKGKAVLVAYVSEDLLRKFKEVVVAKHGSLHGSLSYAVEEALKRWVSEQLRGSQGRRVGEMWSLVKDYLEGRLKYDLSYARHVHAEDVVKALKGIVGSDDKAVSEWLKAFEEFGVLKKVNQKLYEIAVLF
jgi:hypothetical protein